MTAPLKRALRRLAIAGTIACAGPLLVIPSAQASTPFDPNSNLDGQAGMFPSADGNCTGTDDGSTMMPVMLRANAAPIGKSLTASSTVTDAGGLDSVTTTLAGTGRAWLRSSGSDPASVDVAITSARATTTSTLPVSSCRTHEYMNFSASVGFTLTRPTIMTIDAAGHGVGGYRWQISSSPSFPPWDPTPGVSEVSAFGQSERIHTTRYLAAGTYYAFVTASAFAGTNRTVTQSGSSSVHISFPAAGSRTAAHNSAYATMPTARNCSLHSINPRITTNATAAKQIKSVAFRVNGRLVRTAKAPHRGATFKLPATDDQNATVTATAKLRTGKTVTSSASYLQCS